MKFEKMIILLRKKIFLMAKKKILTDIICSLLSVFHFILSFLFSLLIFLEEKIFEAI